MNIRRGRVNAAVWKTTSSNKHRLTTREAKHLLGCLATGLHATEQGLWSEARSTTSTNWGLGVKDLCTTCVQITVGTKQALDNDGRVTKLLRQSRWNLAIGTAAAELAQGLASRKHLSSAVHNAIGSSMCTDKDGSSSSLGQVCSMGWQLAVGLGTAKRRTRVAGTEDLSSGLERSIRTQLGLEEDGLHHLCTAWSTSTSTSTSSTLHWHSTVGSKWAKTSARLSKTENIGCCGVNAAIGAKLGTHKDRLVSTKPKTLQDIRTKVAIGTKTSSLGARHDCTRHLAANRVQRAVWSQAGLDIHWLITTCSSSSSSWKCCTILACCERCRWNPAVWLQASHLHAGLATTVDIAALRLGTLHNGAVGTNGCRHKDWVGKTKLLQTIRVHLAIGSEAASLWSWKN